jgi:hypothetical protein
MSGYLVSGSSGSWEDQGWGGMAGEYDDAIQSLRMQAQSLRANGQPGAAQELEQQANAMETMQQQEKGGKTKTNWLLWGGIALGAFLLFGKK